MMIRFAKIALPLSLLGAAVLPQLASADDAVQIASATSAADFKGKMLYGPTGERLAAVYRVSQDGAAQIILNGKMISVPASTLTAADGKLATSLSKRDLLTSR
jgi:hypothetical protein